MILRLPSRLAVPLVTAGVLAAACEPAEFPVAPSAEPVFTTISFDRGTAQPSTAFPILPASAGSTYDYSFDVAYQRTQDEMLRDSDAIVYFRLMLGDSTQSEDGTFTWNGYTWVEDAVQVSEQAGEVNFSGWFELPETGAFCEAYDVAVFWVRVEPADTAIDPAWFTNDVDYQDLMYYGVTGTTATPCAEVNS